VTPDGAEAFLEGTLHGEKHAVIKGTVANTSEKDVKLGTSCSSNSTGTVEGKNERKHELLRKSQLLLLDDSGSR
jgi:hypothetical protein